MGATIRIFLVCGIALCIAACASQNRSKKSFFVQSYKKMVFHYSLQAVTDNKLGQILRDKGGHISFIGEAEELGPAYSDSAAATARRFVATIQPMVPDAREGEDFYQQKPLVAACLAFYESKKLDSIAKVMYKHTQRNQ